MKWYSQVPLSSFLSSYRILYFFIPTQLLKMVAVDIETKSQHLGRCMAVRVAKLCTILGSQLSSHNVEAAMCAKTNVSRKYQQKFLNPQSTDMNICKGRKGQGGNTTSQHCYIIAQSCIDKDHLDAIRKGI